MKASPPVGEVGGGPAASAAEKSPYAAPPPNPPHKGAGLRLRKFAKGAGAVVLGLIALDVAASLATLALGWGMFQR
jgi:hypothetical protein